MNCSLKYFDIFETKYIQLYFESLSYYGAPFMSDEGNYKLYQGDCLNAGKNATR